MDIMDRLKGPRRNLPIGIQSFERLRRDGYLYVDKTAFVYELASTGNPYFLSRPRRFGKSLLLSTLEAYFCGKKELFEGLAIEQLETEWNEHAVLHLDLNAEDYSEIEGLRNGLELQLRSWEKVYGTSEEGLSYSGRFMQVIKEAYRQTGRGVVVLIDEYDKPMLDVLDTQLETVVDGNKMLLEERNRNVLKGFYSVFKAADEHLQFVLLTGVTKFSQVSVFSGFNQPEDISMSGQFESLCGITQEELESYFAEPIAAMAESYRCDVPTMERLLKAQYDGYHFSPRMQDVYNPFSLLNAFKSGRIDDYWFQSGTPTYLIRLLRHTKENLNELTGRYYAPREFVDYKADVEKPLPMIYQSGYLTIKDYKLDRNTFLLDFPNNEVKNGFLTMVASDYLRPKSRVNAWVQDSVDALQDGDPEKFRRLLTSFLSSIPYTMRRKENEREKERYFHYTFFLLLRLVSVYTMYTEKEQSGGRVDCIMETDNYVYIFEFKLDGTADEALRQIEEKGYALPYLADKRKLYRIGVSFSSETGTVEEWKLESSE